MRRAAAADGVESNGHGRAGCTAAVAGRRTCRKQYAASEAQQASTADGRVAHQQPEGGAAQQRQSSSTVADTQGGAGYRHAGTQARRHAGTGQQHTCAHHWQRQTWQHSRAGARSRQRAGRRWRACALFERPARCFSGDAGGVDAGGVDAPDAASRGSAPGQSKICALLGPGRPRVLSHRPATRPGPLWTAEPEAATARPRCGRPAPAPRAPGFRPGFAWRSTRRSAWLRRR